MVWDEWAYDGKGFRNGYVRDMEWFRHGGNRKL